MRILKNLAGHKLVVLAIALLLVVQASCDLALPNYTSQIVDVGIQQKGVEHAAADELTARTHDLVALMLPDADEQAFADAYERTDAGTYALTEQARGSAEGRAALDDAVALPMVAIHYADQIPDLNLDQLQQAYDAGLVSKADIQSMLDQARSQLGDNGDSIIAQQAVAAAQQEYEQLGGNLNDLQLSYLLRTGGTMLAIAALGMAVAVVVGLIASRLASKIGAGLRSGIFSQVVRFSDADVQRFSAASLITRATNDVQLVQMVTVMLLRMVLYAPIAAIGGIIMISSTNLSMSWVIVVAVVAISAVVGLLMGISLPKFKLMQKLIDRVNLVSREMLTGLPVVRAFDRQAHEQERFDAANTNLMKTQLFTNRVMTFMLPVMMLVMNLVSVLIVWVGGHAIDAGTLQTGDLIAFITYAMVIIMGFLMIGMVSIMLPRADVAAERIHEVISAKPSIADPDPACARDAELATHIGGAEIAFHDVSFKYGDSSECVLEHVSFTAAPGTTTAIVGSTGSGKSTVVKLIERFHDVTAGSVTVDGVDVRDVSQAALRRALGYVPQQSFLFSGTIASNIGYGEDDPDDARIRQAAAIAQAAGFIEEKDEGYDSPVAQGGTNVSGGQRQRLAIARALATDARAFLFDDSFSALDYKTDAVLRRQLADQLGDRTVIIVAQRIATVLHADQIIVLDEGRVVGAGTHAQLMEACPEYREIALSQLSEAELEGGDAR